MSCYISRLPNPKKCVANYAVRLINCSVLWGGKYGNLFMIHSKMLPVDLTVEQRIITWIINWQVCDLYSLDSEEGGSKLFRYAQQFTGRHDVVNYTHESGKQHSNWVTDGLEIRKIFVLFPTGARISCFSKAPGKSLRPTHPLMQSVRGSVCQWGKGERCEADDLPPSEAEVCCLVS
jgi:hypothetical protein